MPRGRPRKNPEISNTVKEVVKGKPGRPKKVVPLNPNIESKGNTEVEEIIVGDKHMQGKIQVQPKDLSFQARKWSDYLDYTKWEPDAFLMKYPNHKFKEFIEEIIEFRKKSS